MKLRQIYKTKTILSQIKPQKPIEKGRSPFGIGGWLGVRLLCFC
jgi:hypothetical protein